MTTLYAYNRDLKADLKVVGTYDYGGKTRLIYADGLDALAAVLKQRIKDKRQNVIVVQGSTGSGKSTFAIQLARAMDPKWDLAKNYIYGVEDLKRKLADPKSSPISLFDEGSIALNSNNSMRDDDKKLVLLFDTMRSLGWTSIICIPSIKNLNKRVREYHVDYMCMCPSYPLVRGFETRGFAQIYIRMPRDWQDPYYRMIATLIYPPLKPSQQARYDEIKLAHQMDLIEDFISEDEE